MEFRKNQRGIIFFTTVLLLGITVLICSAVTLMVSRDAYTVRRIQYTTQAYFLAESGVERALDELTADFSWAGVGAVNFGEGTYAVTIAAHPVIVNRKVITSTGTVKGISRVIKVQVQNNVPPSFYYAILSGGWQWISSYTTINGLVHSNSNDPSIDDIWIGSLAPFWFNPPVINGIVSASGNVYVSNGTLNPDTGNPISNSMAVPLPPFDNDFFNWYANNANRTYTGNQTFSSSNNPWATPGCNLVYVKAGAGQPGNVRFSGSLTFTGCLVADGNITFPLKIFPPWYTLSQSQYSNLPAFISRNGSININAGTNLTVNGMMYSGNYYNEFILTGSATINGAIYTGGPLLIRLSTVNYVQPNPPGLSYPTGISVLSWSES